MRLRVLIQDQDTATPFESQPVRVLRATDGLPITDLATDGEGFVDWQISANPVWPAALVVEGQPGGTKTWDTRDGFNAGVIPFSDVPAALFDLEGVIGGYQQQLLVTGSGNALSVAPGAAVVAGHPVVLYSAQPLTITRPTVSTRVDRVILRLVRATGQATLLTKPGVEGGSAPALTQDATTWEQSLATLTIPTGAAPLTITDERRFAGQERDIVGSATVALVSTANTSGEALAGASAALTLPAAAVYDVTAEVTAHQTDTGDTWATLLTVTSANGLAFNNPGQVAVDPSGNVYIADTGNARLVKLNSSGAYLTSITGLTGVIGVCVDAAGNVTVTQNTSGTVCAIQHYTSALVLVWVASGLPGQLGHLTTDGIAIWYTRTDSARISKREIASPITETSFGSPGSGNGQFATPWAVTYKSSGHLYVVDSGNNRLQTFTLAGAYLGQLISLPAGLRGLAFLPGEGHFLLCDPTNDVLQRLTTSGFLMETIAVTNPTGIAITATSEVWVSSTDNTVRKLDYVTGNYGDLAIAIGGDLSPYLGISSAPGEIANAHAASVSGPTSLTVTAYGKSDGGTALFRALVLSVRAAPRR